MSERSKNVGTGIWMGIAVALILLGALGVYVGGYVVLSTEEQVVSHLQKIGEPRSEYTRARAFQYGWQARLYVPAAKVEALIRGEPVESVNLEPTGGK